MSTGDPTGGPTPGASPPSPALPAPKIVRPVVAPPARGSVLVIAPHPDDESIGPGATLAAHARAGDEIHALFVTSGVHGDVDGDGESAAYVAERRREAEAAAVVLGIGTTEFWGYPDNMVVTEADLAAVTERLAALLEQRAPDVIYVPHAGEQHSDHHFVSLAAQRAWRGQGCRGTLYGYEVWSPLDADIAVDVAETYPLKLDAIRCYATQLERNDIPRAVDGLNRFRAVLLPSGGQWAEVFEEYK